MSCRCSSPCWRDAGVGFWPWLQHRQSPVLTWSPSSLRSAHMFTSQTLKAWIHPAGCAQRWGRALRLIHQVWEPACRYADQAHRRDVGAMHPGSLTLAARSRRSEAQLAVLASHIRVLACLLNIPHGWGLFVEFLILTPRIHMDWRGTTTVA